MQIDFDQPIDRRNTLSEKWELYREQDILPLWVADTDFQSPPPVIEALQERVAHGVFGYTDTPEQLIDVVIQRMKSLYDWNIEREWLVWLPGLVCGLNLACRMLPEDNNENNKKILTPSPIYPPFMSAPKLSGKQVVSVAMAQIGDRWILDFDALEENISQDTQLLLFCNPHNPAGTVYRHEELLQLADIAKRHNLTICSDEIHCDLILEKGLKHIPFGSLNEDAAARSVTLMAPSKTFNIAGLGCSFAIIPDPVLRKQFSATAAGIVPSANLLGYTAALAAYEQGDEWLVKQLDYLRDNRDYLVEEINQISGLKILSIEATYLAWIDISSLKLENPLEFFENAGVGLSPGADFGDNKYMRLNFGCTRETLQIAVKRIRKAVREHLSN